MNIHVYIDTYYICIYVCVYEVMYHCIDLYISAYMCGGVLIFLYVWNFLYIKAFTRWSKFKTKNCNYNDISSKHPFLHGNRISYVVQPLFQQRWHRRAAVSTDAVTATFDRRRFW